MLTVAETLQSIMIVNLILGLNGQLPDISALSGSFDPDQFGDLLNGLSALEELVLPLVPETKCLKTDKTPRALTYRLTTMAPVDVQQDKDFMKYRLIMVTIFLDCDRNNTAWTEEQLKNTADAGTALISGLVSGNDFDLGVFLDAAAPSALDTCKNNLAIVCANYMRDMCAWTRANRKLSGRLYINELKKRASQLKSIYGQREKCNGLSDDNIVSNVLDTVGLE